MKFAILSDIHGNIYALKKCFEYIEKLNIDGIIWCGDYITDIPRPNEVLDFIKETMKKYTTFKVGGPAECLIKIDNEADLKEILNFANENNIEIHVVGNGSNLLVLDGGIKGIVLL